MHQIILSQFVDDDDDVITTASTDPEALSVSVLRTGEIIDVDVDSQRMRPLGVDGFSELFVACAQAAFASRYDSLPQS